MNEQIDRVVRDILGNLAQARTANPLVAACLDAHGAGWLRTAAELRAVLDNWTIDETLPADNRAYARQQLDSLPDF